MRKRAKCQKWHLPHDISFRPDVVGTKGTFPLQVGKTSHLSNRFVLVVVLVAGR